MAEDTSKRGFASMDKEKQHDIASQGGKTSGGNFKNDPEKASEAGKDGGKASSGGSHEQHVKAGEQSHKNG